MKIDGAYVTEVAFIDDEKVFVGTVRVTFKDHAFDEIRNIGSHDVTVGITISGEADWPYKKVETALIRQASALLSATSEFLTDATYESLAAHRAGWREETERENEERNNALFSEA